jgi:hypothetical protein
VLLPTFFVIGAGKSGTTALHAYLGLHPEIEMTATKEVHFLLGPQWRTRVAGYAGQYAGGTAQRGDASPGYTVHPRHADTPERMAELVPAARCIYILRDPVERAIAQYAQHVITHTERRPPHEALDPADPANDYLCISAYGAQLEHYLRVLDPDRILVLDQTDLLDDRAGTLGRAFAFLGVDPAFTSPDFERTHNVRAADNVRLPRPLARAEPLARRLVPPRARAALRGAARARFGQPVEPEVDATLRARIAERLAPEAARVRELTGLPFAGWSV